MSLNPPQKMAEISNIKFRSHCVQGPDTGDSSGIHAALDIEIPASMFYIEQLNVFTADGVSAPLTPEYPEYVASIATTVQ